MDDACGQFPSTTLRRFPGPPDKLGEGPMWNETAGRIEWVDVVGETESSSRPDGSDVVRKPLTGGPAGFAYRAHGGRILSTHHRLLLRDELGGERGLSVPAFDEGREWFNDCACDSQGRFWVGSLASDFRSNFGALYRVDPDLSAHRMDEGFFIGNGIGWSPDETILYFCDTRQAVFAYDYAIGSGEILNRRIFASFPEAEGSPDGLAVDVDGCVWVAMAHGAQILRLRPDGSIDRRVGLPVNSPTSLSFGGPGRQTLFVTTMAPMNGSAPRDGDGLIFAFEPGVAGLPVHRFGG